MAAARAGRASRPRTPPNFPRVPELKADASITIEGDALARFDRAQRLRIVQRGDAPAAQWRVASGR